MLQRALFRRSVSSTLRFARHQRSLPAMSSPSQSVSETLNPKLYADIRNLWFQDLAKDASTPKMELMQKWFGLNQSAEQKKSFDDECRARFEHVLQALGPDRWALPPFESYEKDIANADALSGPLLGEVKAAHARDGQAGAETLLSLVILLDQLPRNIYRDAAGLRLVYNHYDRLALSLVYGSSQISPSPRDVNFFQTRPVYHQWFQMPLMHAEHLPSHELWYQVTRKMLQDLRAGGKDEEADYVMRSVEAEDAHYAPIKRFGRYPHRNQSLGRTSTSEEVEYLKDGVTFGVEQK